MSDEEDEDYFCAHCRRTLAPGDSYVSLTIEWGDGPDTYGEDYLWFCNQDHAAAYLSSTRLPPPVPFDRSERSDGWFHRHFAGVREVGFTLFWGVMLVANLGFYVLGFVTWLRWIWSR